MAPFVTAAAAVEGGAAAAGIAAAVTAVGWAGTGDKPGGGKVINAVLLHSQDRISIIS